MKIELLKPVRLPADPVVLQQLLEDTGGALWRGAISSLADLERVTQSWFGRFHQPATRVDASEHSQDGYTSRVGTTGYLLGHAEGYYRPGLPPPDVCVFWCQRAPTVPGGETTWFDGAALCRALPTELAARLADEGVVYEALWPRSRWQAEFGVADVTALQAVLYADASCRHTLNAADELHLFHHVQPILQGADGVPRFINGLLAHLPAIEHPRYAGRVYSKPSNRLHWGGGGELEPAAVNALIDAHDAVLHKHRWQDGDLLVLDNHRLLHGREPMVGEGDRVIYSRFGYCS